MQPSVPITQDVLTLPRKLSEGLINLVGLTRDELHTLIEAGTPKNRQNARRANMAMDLRKGSARV